jgi:hypothetical protein
MSACGRCASPLEAGDLRCAVCALAAPMALVADRGPDLAVAAIQILRCGECGAAVGFVAEVGAPRCAFCGAVTAVERPVDPVEAPTQRVPFRVDRDAARAALRGWLGRRGFFAPRDLADAAIVEQLAPLAWACWVINAEAEVAWTADSDAGAQRSAWAPHAGVCELTFANLAVPGTRGLTGAEARALVRGYDLSTARAIVVGDDGEAGDPGDPLAGEAAVVEQFALQRSAARRLLHGLLEDQAAARVERTEVPGNQVRNVNVGVLVRRLSTARVALPAWVLSYRYGGRPYRAIVHGQDADLVLGKAPVDRGKVALVVAAIAAGVVAVIALTYFLAR